MVLLVPRVQVGCVFLGYPAGALIHESPGDPLRLVFGSSTVVRTDLTMFFFLKKVILFIYLMHTFLKYFLSYYFFPKKKFVYLFYAQQKR